MLPEQWREVIESARSAPVHEMAAKVERYGWVELPDQAWYQIAEQCVRLWPNSYGIRDLFGTYEIYLR